MMIDSQHTPYREMRYLILTLALLLIFPACSYGQTAPSKCDSTLLNKGKTFITSNPKSLEGTYTFTIVPTWDPQATKAIGELHLFWEDRYVSMQNNHKYQVPQQFPLVGYINGDFSKATILNFNEEMSRTDPLNPGVRYHSDNKNLEIPGDEPVDPSCPNCLNICADCPSLTFTFNKIVNGTIVGKWSHELGIRKTKNSVGDWVHEATGFFCAEPKN